MSYPLHHSCLLPTLQQQQPITPTKSFQSNNQQPSLNSNTDLQYLLTYINFEHPLNLSEQELNNARNDFISMGQLHEFMKQCVSEQVGKQAEGRQNQSVGGKRMLIDMIDQGMRIVNRVKEVGKVFGIGVKKNKEKSSMVNGKQGVIRVLEEVIMGNAPDMDEQHNPNSSKSISSNTVSKQRNKWFRIQRQVQMFTQKPSHQQPQNTSSKKYSFLLTVTLSQHLPPQPNPPTPQYQQLTTIMQKLERTLQNLQKLTINQKLLSKQQVQIQTYMNLICSYVDRLADKMKITVK